MSGQLKCEHDSVHPGSRRPVGGTSSYVERLGATMPQPHKEAAMEFLRLAASGSVREAYQKHVAAGFRHHNPYFRGDAESLAAGIAENCAKFPDKKLEIQRAVEEGDLVAVHSRVKMKPG